MTDVKRNWRRHVHNPASPRKREQCRRRDGVERKPRESFKNREEKNVLRLAGKSLAKKKADLSKRMDHSFASDWVNRDAKKARCSEKGLNWKKKEKKLASVPYHWGRPKQEVSGGNLSGIESETGKKGKPDILSERKAGKIIDTRILLNRHGAHKELTSQISKDPHDVDDCREEKERRIVQEEKREKEGVVPEDWTGDLGIVKRDGSGALGQGYLRSAAWIRQHIGWTRGEGSCLRKRPRLGGRENFKDSHSAWKTSSEIAHAGGEQKILGSGTIKSVISQQKKGIMGPSVKRKSSSGFMKRERTSVYVRVIKETNLAKTRLHVVNFWN